MLETIIGSIAGRFFFELEPPEELASRVCCGY